VSMDCVGATYEALRGKTVLRPFDRGWKLFVRMAPFGINFVINSRTFADLERRYRSCARVPERVSSFYCRKSRWMNGWRRSGTLSALQEWVAKYRGAVPLAISESHSKDVCSDTLSAEAGFGPNAHVDANGFLKRSSYAQGGA